jgi:16S rRNA A1518/A1519 N6-dimethyltransferase RsmA/KsgA/DIM1 with predicted DNA glycosylase/AP lyase activity
VVRIEPFRPERLTPDQEVRVRGLVRAAFQWRRKQMGKILRDHPDLAVPAAAVDGILARLGVAPTERPERLDPDTFLLLADALP